MRNLYSVSISLLLFVSSCGKLFYPAEYSYEQTKIAQHRSRDESIWEQILPYKDSLDIEMNRVLAYSDTVLTKSIPESDLGNFMCDLILNKSRDYFMQRVDFTVLNNGGIRIPNLPKGEITLGKIIELMPFENRIVLMRVSGSTVDSLFNHMAARGGWQVSGARYKVKNGKATQVEIAGTPLDVNDEYTLAISDYLAQGGDDCTMLVFIPYIDSRKTLRDALIEGLLEMNQRGERIKSVMDGRVQTTE